MGDGMLCYDTFQQAFYCIIYRHLSTWFLTKMCFMPILVISDSSKTLAHYITVDFSASKYLITF